MLTRKELARARRFQRRYGGNRRSACFGQVAPDMGPGCFGSYLGAREVPVPRSKRDFASESQLEGEVGEEPGVTIMVNSDPSRGYVEFETREYDMNSGYKSQE